ncbi:uncharacterized protein LOC133507884 isoform X2 [Syngnathoides biaculeatus]|uniref:uncharacterized protein LOC133507884 isoform X2 n=1 Tax=Syngnathoides biaculeatus TaxID=300417 RepID=UPI002ADDAA56|nr:uncharacterized protein LOC133507884 isoform X2 [Syngnathoides biaculeatus]
MLRCASSGYLRRRFHISDSQDTAIIHPCVSSHGRASADLCRRFVDKQATAASHLRSSDRFSGNWTLLSQDGLSCFDPVRR